MSQIGNYDVLLGTSIVTITGDAGGAVSGNGAGNINFTGTVPLTVTGTPATNSLDVALATPVTVAYGGTGVNTLADHGILLGSAANAVTVTAAPTDGQLLIGSTGNDPVLATVTAGIGIDIINAAGSVTVNTSGGGLAWTEVVGVAQATAVSNGYILNNAGLVTATLPAVAVVGDVIAIAGKGAGGWIIAQNAAQTIHVVNMSTTVGVGGSLASTNQYDCVELVCITANTDFVARSVMGNLAIV